MVKQQQQEILFYLMAWSLVLGWGCLTYTELHSILLVIASLCSIRTHFQPKNNNGPLHITTTPAPSMMRLSLVIPPNKNHNNESQPSNKHPFHAATTTGLTWA